MAKNDPFLTWRENPEQALNASFLINNKFYKLFLRRE
jgi:hypothetical protein